MSEMSEMINIMWFCATCQKLVKDKCDVKRLTEPFYGVCECPDCHMAGPILIKEEDQDD